MDFDGLADYGMGQVISRRIHILIIENISTIVKCYIFVSDLCLCVFVVKF